jgi:hypothetical protein
MHGMCCPTRSSAASCAQQSSLQLTGSSTSSYSLLACSIGDKAACYLRRCAESPPLKCNCPLLDVGTVLHFGQLQEV